MHSSQWLCVCVCTAVQVALQGFGPTAFLLALLQQCFLGHFVSVVTVAQLLFNFQRKKCANKCCYM